MSEVTELVDRVAAWNLPVYLLIATRLHVIFEDLLSDPFLLSPFPEPEPEPAPRRGGAPRPSPGARASAILSQPDPDELRVKGLAKEFDSQIAKYNDQEKWFTLDGKRKFKFLSVGWQDSKTMYVHPEYGYGPAMVKVFPHYRKEDYVSDFCCLWVRKDGLYRLYAADAGGDIAKPIRVVSEGMGYVPAIPPDKEPKKATVADIQREIIEEATDLLPRIIAFESKGKQVRRKRFPEIRFSGSKERGYELHFEGYGTISKKTLNDIREELNRLRLKVADIPDPMEPYNEGLQVYGAILEGDSTRIPDMQRLIAEYDSESVVFEEYLSYLKSSLKKASKPIKRR